MARAARVSVSAYGVIAALAGVEHGVGAMLQGNVRPDGLVIQSWPDAPAYAVLSGEPAMTLVPNMLLSGVLTVVVSVGLAVWSVGYVGTDRGGPVLIGLSVLLLLVGGGFGPPILGLVLGLAATRLDEGWPWFEEHVSGGIQRALAVGWRFLLALGVACWLALWPGLVLVNRRWTVDDPVLVGGLVALAFAAFFASLAAGFAADSLRRPSGRPA
ncbi:hypothetical protein [Halosimplex amylolyticum]|uniref:hypothetical protein n=1 Tax=Halosimplex amylolyticum TaxID=3396616 RepID=UPI003F5445A0